MNSILRDTFYQQHEDFHHTFDDGEYYLEYGLYGSVPLSKELHQEIQKASVKLWKILNKVKAKVTTLSTDELVSLGFNKRIIPYLKIDPLTTHTVTSRFDIIRTEDSFKFIELNNDTPFLIMENYKMDDVLNNSLGKPSLYPRRRDILSNSMYKALKESADYINKPLEDCTIALMGYDYEEDLEEYTTLKFYQSIITQLGLECHYLNYTDIRVDMEKRDVMSTQTDTIDILLKFAYPYEFLINDTYLDKEGYIGIDMMELMKEKRVAILNTPASHILQNKGIFSYVFYLVEHTNFFDNEEKKFIEKYLPYTSFSEKSLRSKNIPYVKKAVISREGQSVEIFLPNETYKSSINLYDDETFIYQEYIPAPTRKVIVQDKEQELIEILGVFIADNQYAGTVCRLGDIITDWYSYWIAMYEKD